VELAGSEPAPYGINAGRTVLLGNPKRLFTEHRVDNPLTKDDYADKDNSTQQKRPELADKHAEVIVGCTRNSVDVITER